MWAAPCPMSALYSAQWPRFPLLGVSWADARASAATPHPQVTEFQEMPDVGDFLTPMMCKRATRRGLNRSKQSLGPRSHLMHKLPVKVTYKGKGKIRRLMHHESTVHNIINLVMI